eukprot:349476-Rhodomonas_salina.1
MMRPTDHRHPRRCKRSAVLCSGNKTTPSPFQSDCALWVCVAVAAAPWPPRPSGTCAERAEGGGCTQADMRHCGRTEPQSSHWRVSQCCVSAAQERECSAEIMGA